MKMTNASAQRLLQSLRTIDSAEGIRLSGKTRLDIARNINRLMPEMVAFETACNRKSREIIPGDEYHTANSAIAAEIDDLRAMEVEIKLWRLTPADLSLDDNQRITGDMVAALAPILKDFDTMDPPE